MQKMNRTRFAKGRSSHSAAILEALEPRLLLSLVAHLELNETSGTTAVDTVGDHDGTLYSDVTWDDGRINNGACFDGSGGYIDVANSDDFNFGTADSFTISTWVRDDGGGYYASAVSRGGTSAIGLGISTNNDGPGWFIGRYSNFDGGFTFSLSDGTNGTSASHSPSLADGYHLLTMVVDRSTDEMRCYVDATLFVTRDISSIGSLDGGSDVMQIGGSTSWDGIVDDVRVYDHALSTGDVEDLYDDAPTWVSIYADDAIATEDEGADGTATFRVLRTGTLSGAITVNYSVSGMASAGDYSETLGGTVTIADGESYANITVTPIDDATADDAETLTLTLASGTGYVVSEIDDATTVIYDEAGLLAHWELDETSGSTAGDSSGYGFTGTLYGDTTWTDGRIGNGASFDGSSDTIAVDGAGVDFGGDQSFTVSAWVQDDGALRTAAVSKGHSRAHYNVGGEGAGWAMGRYLSGKLSFGVSDGINYVYYSAGTYPSGSTFYLMTMVVDRDTQYMSCYIDGQLKNQVDISSVGSLASYDESLYISTGTWDGIIDDVQVYNCALDSTAVSDIYNAAFPSVQIIAEDDTAYENSGETAVFRVYRGGTDGDLAVNYSVSGTATSADYSETLGGTVTIADGNTYVDITITPVDDGTADNGETLTLTLASGTDYQIGENDDATITIYDSDYLLAHWKLDETSGTTAYDSVNDHDGTLLNGAVWDDGRIDNGIGLDGTNDRIDVSDANDFDFGASTSFTVSAWVRDDSTNSYYPSAVARGNRRAGWNNLWGAGWTMGGHEDRTPGRIYFGITDGSNGVGYSSGGIYDSRFFHLVTMVVDRSAGTLYCYVDGELDGSADISSVGSISSPDEPLRMGIGNDYLEGVIDDVRVYASALSANDVAALYNNAPTCVGIYVDDAIATEDAIGADGATFYIVRTGSDDGAIAVNYTVSGTASSGDYSETLSGTVTMADGQQTAAVIITPVADAADDGETLTLTLISGTGYTVSDIDSATAVIYDDIGLLAHWELDETSGTTAADSTGNGFTGTRYYDAVWTDGRIDNGAYFDGSGDYISMANAEAIDFGEDQSFTVSLWVRDDGGTYNAAITKGNDWAHMGSADDGAGWSIGNTYQNEFAFGISDGVSAADIRMDTATDNGSHLLTMTVDRGADQLRCYVDGVLMGLDDISGIGSLASFAEPLLISGSGTQWAGMIDDVRIYTYALNASQVAALYNAAPPVVAVEAIDEAASETGSEPGVFRVVRDGDTDAALEVDYTVTGGATSGDYSEMLSGTVIIAAGESYADITVTPVDDATNEGNETVVLTLQPSSDYAIYTPDDGTATVTIGDSDNVAGPQVVIAAVDSEGSEDGSETATFRVYRSGATTADLAVNYSASGTAEGDDYSETLSGTVTITSGNSYADITITPVTDSNFEYPETLTLTADANYSVGLSDDATAMILDIPFSAQINPTGDMIGGGEGYSDIIDSGDADYVVDTAAELVAALSSASYGDIIYVEDDAEIDLTGYIANTYYNALWVPAGVTLASGRGNNGSAGGLIYTTDNWDDMYRVAMLGTAGDDIRITGLRIQGPSGYSPEAAEDQYAIGIRCSWNGTANKHSNIEVDNCEIYNWTMAGVYAMYGEGVSIHHNFIHTNVGTGYQYGIWFGGFNEIANEPEWCAVAETNLFDCNRHDIGSGCHWPWAARYNIFGPNQVQQLLDRHGGASVDTWIESNWFQAYMSSQTETRIGFNSDAGGTVYYNHNWTHRENLGPLEYYVATTAIYGDPTYVEVEATGNTMDFEDYEGVYLPVAASTATHLSDPYTVSFDSSDSYDPEGCDIVSHQWWFGDGSGTQGVVSYEDNPTYTYSDAGMYEVIHWAYNEYGVAGYENFTVLIRPEESGYWLSAWIRDDCAENIPVDTAYKQILIDDEVVWSDDVVGDDGWQHVMLDISSYVSAGTGIKLAFALASDGGYAARMSVDNAYIFGGDVANSRMDSDVYDPWLESEDTDWDMQIPKARAGRLATGGGLIITSGASGMSEIYQYVPIGRALEAMVTDDFESGDGTGGDNWDANWVLTGSAAVTSSGTPYDGTYHLLLTGSSAVASRAVDLSGMDAVGYDDVTLSFEYKADSFETGEEVSVEIYDGTQWQEVMIIEDGDDDGEYHLASTDLSGYSLTDDFEIRFTASLADASDFFYVDDLMIA